MASPGSLLPGGFSLGRLSHADRVGLIYRARPTDPSDARSACALVLHPLHVDELRDWFEKMAVLGRSLRHPNLVEVYALGYTSNDLPVVVTEWVDGRTLRAELASGRVFSAPDVVKILREVTSALGYLHSRTPPVLHRALMPETVMITSPMGTVKVLAVGHADRPHHPASKPSALSPEELMSDALSVASDVYSLASLAYELITGRPAFAGGTMQVLTAMRHGVFPSVVSLTNEAAAPIDAALRRAWSFEPQRRHPTAAAFFEDLEAAITRVPSATLAMRRVVGEHPARFTSAPPMLPGSAGLRPSAAPAASSRPPGTRAVPVDVVRGRTTTGPIPTVGSPVNPMPTGARAPRVVADLVVPRLSATNEVDASALLPFSTTRDETTVRVPREQLDRHDTIDVGDAFLSLGSGVIDDPEVIAVIAREQEAEREERARSPALNAPPPDEGAEITRELPDIGDDVTQNRAPERKRRITADARSSPPPEPVTQSDEPVALLSIPKAPPTPDARSLGMPSGRSFEEWAPKVPERPTLPWYRREVSFTLPAVVVLLVLHALLTAVLVHTLQLVWAPRPDAAAPRVVAPSTEPAP